MLASHNTNLLAWQVHNTAILFFTASSQHDKKEMGRARNQPDVLVMWHVATEDASLTRVAKQRTKEKDTVSTLVSQLSMSSVHPMVNSPREASTVNGSDLGVQAKQPMLACPLVEQRLPGGHRHTVRLRVEKWGPHGTGPRSGLAVPAPGHGHPQALARPMGCAVMRWQVRKGWRQEVRYFRRLI